MKICSILCSLILKFPAHGMKKKSAKNSMLRKGSEVSRFCTKNCFEQTKSKNKFCEKIQDWNCLLDPVSKTKVFRKMWVSKSVISSILGEGVLCLSSLTYNTVVFLLLFPLSSFSQRNLQKCLLFCSRSRTNSMKNSGKLLFEEKSQ